VTTLVSNFVNAFKKEGIDHIRINPYAETQLGKILSKNWRATFFIPGVGEFSSPMCFANWILSGDEAARHDVRFQYEKPSRDFNKFVMYAKYYQLCKLSNLLKKHNKDLPFVVYKVHITGLKEFDTWKEYPNVVKAMVEHLVDPNRGPKVAFDWSCYQSDIQELVNGYIKNLVPEKEKESDSHPKPKQRKNKDKETEPVLQDNCETTESATKTDD